MRTVDKLLALEATVGLQSSFAVAGDGRRVLYLSDSGRLECLDRFTGQSLWIYSFPVLWIDDSQGAKWMGGKRFTASTLSASRQFYVERAAYCDRELEARDILPFLVDGAKEPEPPAIILDPSPNLRHRDNVLPAAIAAWVLSLSLLAGLFAIWKSTARLLFKSLALVAVIAATVTVYVFLGGYSWYTFTLLRIDFWGGVVLLLFPAARRLFLEWMDGWEYR